MKPRTCSQLLLPTLPFVLAAATASAQQPGRPSAGPPGLPAGVTREMMWPAPSADDWTKPCLIQWQRSYEDALAVCRETGRPLLVCVNMDGEIASEHYAGVRYREPAIARLYEPYVCVIASVYRHNPRDYDEEGRRILCPRFGSVTCGEHIAIEPGLHDKYMDGQRVAPRHIGVETRGVEQDGKEMYDVFYAWDTDTIFNSLRDGVAHREAGGPTIVRGDRPIVERVASRDLHDRMAVEKAYQQGDHELRRALLDAARAHPEAAPAELLRLAIFGFDVDLSRDARRALAESTSADAVAVIGEALRVPMEPAEHDALVAALSRLGEASPRARTLAVVYQGLSSHGGALDAAAWSQALAAAGDAAPAVDRAAFDGRLADQDRLLGSSDPQCRVELAEAFLDAALRPESDPKSARLFLMDAQKTALDAEQIGAKGWRVNATLALAASRLGDDETARTRAEVAVGDAPVDPQGAAAAAVLELFARARGRDIGRALRERRSWPPSWFTDLHGAYTLLLHHPFGTDGHAASHYDVLKWIGVSGEAAHFLDEGLARFPASAPLHDRLRARLLEERGPAGLEAAYDTLLRERGESADLQGFAGYASLVAAEFHRRAAAPIDALAAYDRAAAHYERAIAADATTRATADHFIAMAHAGRARVASERQQRDHAVAELLAAFERRPDAAATPDGLGITAVATAKVVLKQLADLKQRDLAARLQAALDRLDPALLELPDYERIGARRGQ